MKVVNVHDAKTHLSRLLEEAKLGEEIIIAKNGEAYVRLVPVAPYENRKLGFLEGFVDAEFFDELPEDELSSWD